MVSSSRLAEGTVTFGKHSAMVMIQSRKTAYRLDMTEKLLTGT